MPPTLATPAKPGNSPKDVDPKNYSVSGDVSAAFDNQGHAFVCYIAFDKLGTFNYWAHGATRNGIFVRRSLDGGKTWEANHFPVAEQPTAPGIPFEDKPIHRRRQHARANTPAIFMLDGRVGASPIRRWFFHVPPTMGRRGHSRSRSMPILACRVTTTAQRKDSTAWSALMELSTRSGVRTTRSCSPPRGMAERHSPTRAPAIHTAPIMFAIDTLDRANGFPQIAMDPGGKRLYVSWSDYRNGDIDVFLAISEDRGKHWSSPIRVNDDLVHNGAEQFFQWLAVDPVDGSVNRHLLRSTARSRETANRSSFSHARPMAAVTSRTMPGPTNLSRLEAYFFGDYSGLAAYGGHVYGAWTEQPAPAAESDRDTKDAKPSAHGTVVKVGTADFSAIPAKRP